MSVPVPARLEKSQPRCGGPAGQRQDLKPTGRDIEKALAKYIQEPVVTVIVTGFVGPYGEQIRVVGQAAKPQALP